MREGEQPAHRKPSGTEEERDELWDLTKALDESDHLSMEELDGLLTRALDELDDVRMKTLDESDHLRMEELDELEDWAPHDVEFWDPSEFEDEKPDVPAVWVVREGRHVGVALRSGRRRLGWNQRELAKRAGLSQATIARLEAGTDSRFSVVVRALWACGLELLAAPPAGAPQEWRVAPHPMDEGRDTAGHRLPAHLPAYSTEHLPSYTMWKRMLRGEDLITPRAPHWLYAYEPWPLPLKADEADLDP